VELETDIANPFNLSTSELAQRFLIAAVSGASKIQIYRHFTEVYKLSEKEIEQLVRLCSFKSKPKHIDYNYFYNLKDNLPKEAEQIRYPFTQMYVLDDFLSKDICNDLINVVSDKFRPSSVSNSDDVEMVTSYRTSKTADLHPLDAPFAAALDAKFCDVLKLDNMLGETIQCQQYEIGQYYKVHCDFYDLFTKEHKVYTEWMGQRTWTILCYLNDVKEGGETHFPKLKLKIKPKAGRIVIWNNLYRNGFTNYRTKHEALPPTSGKKYVLTKWFRSWSMI